MANDKASERKLFVDLDGVLGDYPGYYFSQFGVRLSREDVDPDDMFEKIKAHGSFYRDLPPMPDAFALWEGVQKLHPSPIIISGFPRSVPDAWEHKRKWVDRWLGQDVPLILCPAKDKRIFARAGDVLIDDWHKYRALWEEMGGIFILHTSAADSLARAAPYFGTNAET